MSRGDLALFAAHGQVLALEAALVDITRAKTDDCQQAAMTRGEHALKALAALRKAHARELSRQRPEGDDDAAIVEAARVGEVRHEAPHLFSVRVEVWTPHHPAETYDVLVESPRDLKRGWSTRTRRAPIPGTAKLRELAHRHAVREVRQLVAG